MKQTALLALSIASASLVVACGSGGGSDSATNTTTTNNSNGTILSSEYAAQASCGEGSSPETGLQGQVPLADRQSGRSTQGYTCNLKRIGQYQGEGSTWVNPSYKNCAYMATSFSGIPTKKSQGVQVIDVTNPTAPVLSTNLTSPAFLQGTWESLKVNETRGLLGGVAVGPGISAGFFDVYDISQNCAKPVLQNSLGSSSFTLPANLLGHEGAWSPDGKTYWSTSFTPGSITAIDVTDPKSPKIVFTGLSSPTNHGFELRDDGNRMYLTTINPAGVLILDTSSIQSRSPVPMITQISSITWADGATSQHTIPVTYAGKPFILAVDEGGSGASRFIDVSDEKNPKIVSKVKLQIHDPKNAAIRAADTANNGTFGYEGHYCTFDKKVDPTALACGYFQSGVRVFDVRNPLTPKEIAYYNPPAQVGKAAQLPGSEHNAPATGQNANLTADWCSSPPRFVGSDQLWVTCQDNGFMVLQFTNGAYPLAN